MWAYFIFFSLVFLLKTESYVTQHNKTNYKLYPRNDGAKLLLDNIKKPDNDRSSYRLIELPNGLKTLLISSPDSRQAGAAVNVKVGHFSDPDDIPGVAHFCEHLVFMGTKKYPGEDDFSKYLSSHTGTYNAYTSTEDTNYFFSIVNQYFEKALDIFAQFFISPLFSQKSVEREARVVDMENKKNLQSDDWRLFQLEKFISNKKSPYNKFGTGNYATLVENTRKKGIDIASVVSKFYSTYYSSRTMTLVVFSPDSLDKLQELVVKYFSEVPDRNSQKPTFVEKPFGSDIIGKQIWYKPIADKIEMELVFPVDTQKIYYKSNPVLYFKYFLEHQSNGSIYSALKEKGWATSIEVIQEYIVSNTDVFRINIVLTSEGLDNYEEIITLIFGYLKILKEKGVQEWAFRELIKIDNAQFRFKDPPKLTRYVSYIANAMQELHIDNSDLLSHDYVSEYDASHIENLSNMLNKENYFLVIVSKTKPGVWNLREPWYGSEYTIEPFKETLLEKTTKLVYNATLSLPKENPYIPESFIVKNISDNKMDKPLLAYNTSFVRYWYKQDDTFSTPKTSIHALFKIPGYSSSPYQIAQASVYLNMLNSHISETVYYATVVGYQVELSPKNFGIYLSIYGFSDKILLLFENIFSLIIPFYPSDVLFESSRQKLLTDYMGKEYSIPYRYGSSVLSHLSNQLLWPSVDVLHSLKELQHNDIKSFHLRRFFSVFLEVLAVGVLSNSNASYFFSTITEKISRSSQYPYQILPSRAYLLEKGNNYIYELTLPNPLELNSAILYSIQLGASNDPKLLALLTIIHTIMKSPAFDQLRTKEQLGYIVGTISIKTDPLLSFYIVLQSLRDPFYLEQRVNAFLYKFAAFIDTMTEEEFKNHINVLTVSSVPQYKDIFEEASKYISIIKTGYYDFDTNRKMIDVFKTLTKKELRDFFYEYIYPDSSNRKKLSIHLKSQSLEEVSARDLPLRRLQYYFKCQEMNISLNELRDFVESSPKLADFERKIKELLIKMYPNKDVSTIVSQVFVYLKDVYKKLKQDIIKDYNALHFTDATIFKNSLRLSPAPLPQLQWNKYTS